MPSKKVSVNYWRFQIDPLPTFKLVARKEKTTVWTVVNNKSNFVLGFIQWYPSWRQYTFLPQKGSEFNNGCLREIAVFLESLNNQQTAKSEVTKHAAA